MLEKIIDVPVTPQDIEETENLAAGVMFEHNVTALNFQLDTAYQSPDFTYYLEFVTVNGVLRTDYLTPHADGTILFYLPQEVTRQMTVLAVLNIVTFAPDGQTEQLKKSKTVRLYFSSLENTEKALCDSYAFSVNMLLEAIQKGTFKGDKGKTGPMGPRYTLLPTDKQEIADLVNHEHFGLPLYTREIGQRYMNLSNMTNWSALRSFTVSPASIEHSLDFAKIVIGHNLLQSILVPSAFHRFRYNKYFGQDEIYLGHMNGQKFTLTLPRIAVSERRSYLTFDSHQSTLSVNNPDWLNQLALRTDITLKNNSESLCISILPLQTQENYEKVLQNEWDGLTLTETEKSLIVRQEFQHPLRYLSEEYKDSYNFLSGTATYRTHSISLLPEYIGDEPYFTIENGTEPLHAYLITLPPDSPRNESVEEIGFCSAYPIVPYPIFDEWDLEDAIQQGWTTEGICLCSYDDGLYFYSKKTAAEVKADVAAKMGVEPIEVIYPTIKIKKHLAPPQTLIPPINVKEVNVCPYYAKATVEYPTDISEKTIELESRILALENRMHGETL